LCWGAVAVVAVVEVIGMVIVVVGADCTAGFGASCFWHPANANTAAIIVTVMIAGIFFKCFHLLSFPRVTAARSYDMKRI
jgi:hypothetical protein